MANVVIENLGVFYNEGVRGQTGGAAQNDKVWGLANVQGTLVAFWGRRNGKLKFKTYPGKVGRMEATIKWNEKTGNRRSGDVYTPVMNEKMRATFCPNLIADVTKHYFTDLALGKVNTNH